MKHFRDYLTEAKQTGVHLEGDLDAMNCKELESLGNLKTVEGFVYLDGCTALKSLPKDLIVQGFIYGASDELKEKYKDKYEFGQR